MDKERHESNKDNTHTIRKHIVLQQVRVFGGTGETYIRQLLDKCMGQRAHSTCLFDWQKTTHWEAPVVQIIKLFLSRASHFLNLERKT